jgi:hypothetical protein
VPASPRTIMSGEGSTASVIKEQDKVRYANLLMVL